MELRFVPSRLVHAVMAQNAEGILATEVMARAYRIVFFVIGSDHRKVVDICCCCGICGNQCPVAVVVVVVAVLLQVKLDLSEIQSWGSHRGELESDIGRHPSCCALYSFGFVCVLHSYGEDSATQSLCYYFPSFPTGQGMELGLYPFPRRQFRTDQVLLIRN